MSEWSLKANRWVNEAAQHAIGCFSCLGGGGKYDSWDITCMNHQGSSGSMETAGVIEMFSRSLDLYNIRYTTYFGDGDSNIFGKVQETLQQNMVMNIKYR